MHKMKGKRSRTAATNQNITKKTSKKGETTALKVVYISTPMKVTTSAKKFREIVQELTGRESDVARIMESCGGRDTWTVPDDDDQDNKGMISSINIERSVPLMVHQDDGTSPSSSSEELVDHQQFQGVFLRGQENNFGVFDCSSLLYDQFLHQLDVYGSY